MRLGGSSRVNATQFAEATNRILPRASMAVILGGFGDFLLSGSSLGKGAHIVPLWLPVSGSSWIWVAQDAVSTLSVAFLYSVIAESESTEKGAGSAGVAGRGGAPVSVLESLRASAARAS